MRQKKLAKKMRQNRPIPHWTACVRPSRVVHSLGWFGTSLRSSLSLLPTASLLHPFLTMDVIHLTLLSFSVLFVLLFGKFYKS